MPCTIQKLKGDSANFLTVEKQLNNMFFDVFNGVIPWIQTCFSLSSVEKKQFVILF